MSLMISRLPVCARLVATYLAVWESTLPIIAEYEGRFTPGGGCMTSAPDKMYGNKIENVLIVNGIYGSLTHDDRRVGRIGQGFRRK